MTRTRLLVAVLLGAGACQSPEQDSPGQALGDTAIGFYQDHVGHQWGFHCDFQPSCSAFGRESVAQYGLVPGYFMTFDRLLRDHGMDPGAYAKNADGHPLDPVADHAWFAANTRSPGPAVPLQDAEESRPGTATQLLDFAMRLFDAQDYPRAAVEFQRHRYLFPENAERDTATEHLVICLSRLHRDDEALDAVRSLPNPRRQRLQAYLLHKKGETDRALPLLDDDASPGQLLQGMLALEVDQPLQARTSFARLPEPPREWLLARVAAWDERQQKSPVLAGTLSAVLPGAGQVYAGRTADGIVAFCTNAVLIGGTWAALHNDEEVTAGVLGFFALSFYTGNVFGGLNAAHRYNDGVSDQFLDETRGTVRQQEGFGIVPLPDGAGVGWYFAF